jgi:hypothetical protein
MPNNRMAEAKKMPLAEVMRHNPDRGIMSVMPISA